MSTPPPPDPTPTETWVAERAARWLAVADRLEAQIAPVDDVLFAAAAIEPGLRVLDVGCGRGVTTRRAAREVGPDGAVTALDISADLLDQARALAPADAPIEWVVADAQRGDLRSDHYDLVLSRFGVMFFDDPVEAFGRLCRATRPGGRLCVAVWQRRDLSEVMQRPIDVAVAAAGDFGVVLEPSDPGADAFSFGDSQWVRSLLGQAGWSDVAIAPHTLPMYLGGPGTVEQIVDTALAVGPLQRLLDGSPDHLVAAVSDALADDFAARHDGSGILSSGAIAIVTARRAPD